MTVKAALSVLLLVFDLNVLDHLFVREILAVEYVGQVSRAHKIVLHSGFSLLLKSEILDLWELGQEWIVRREKQVGEYLLKVVCFVLLQLHNLEQLLSRDDLACVHL